MTRLLETLDTNEAEGRDNGLAVHAGDDVVVAAVNVERVFGEGDSSVHALRGVSVEFTRGQFSAIMGPSGSGKSTLMHILAGLDRPTSGSVTIDGVEIVGLSDRELTLLRRKKVGFVFQFFNLLPMLTAEENIELPLMIAGDRPDRAWRDSLIQAVGLGNRLLHKPTELSGGQQQRVAVARALLSKPTVVFADEPTGNLDSKTSAEVLGLLRRAADEFDQTIIMVTHDARAAAQADRIVFLSDGSIVRDEQSRLSSDEILDVIKGLE
ncbi:MAG: putative transport system ATP-binding protein [Gaiellales bacterium]|nr:putative transport system ATP-binding protein [Gaiellales bacterium]